MAVHYRSIHNRRLTLELKSLLESEQPPRGSDANDRRRVALAWLDSLLKRPPRRRTSIPTVSPRTAA